MSSAARTRVVRTREVIRDLPNLRDHGRTVDRPLLALLASLQRAHGEAFASEASLRRMVYEDTGHMPGLDTVRRALRRLETQGLLDQWWLLPGGILPDGSECTSGTRLVFVPQCRRDRRVLQSRARTRGREGVTNRIQPRMLASLTQARAAIAKSLEPIQANEAPRSASDDARLRAIAQLGELAAAWEREGKPPS